MEKKCFFVTYCRWRWLRRVLLFMYQTVSLLLITGLLPLSAFARDQDETLNLRMKNVSLMEVMSEITRKTGYDFLYNSDMAALKDKVDVDFRNIRMEVGLNSLFSRHGLEFELRDQVIVVRPMREQAVKQIDQRKLSGTVKDKKGEALPGVTVVLKGTTFGTATDMDGNFQFTITAIDKPVLVFSYVGMKPKEVTVEGNLPVNVILEYDTKEMDEVVITGYFNKTKESFTGSQVTIKADEMKKVGALNLIQALNAFDPSIRLEENLEYGSDPNRVPEITIRGENGFDLRGDADNDRTNPNAPLYILDGVEVSAQRIYDMDMNRVDQTSILKDATATALYGSRGANGVIVITTKRPLPGEIRISGGANYNVSIPDLRDYNLMDASEKLAYEPLAGIWTRSDEYEQKLADIRYNELLKEVKRGVNTYWLSQPLQRSVNQRYSVNFEGGDERIKYGIDLRYDTDKGIMKKSGREKYGIGVNFSYNIGERLFIRNDILVDNVTANNSPYGSFASFARQNPYDRIYDDEGNFVLKLSSGDYNPLINPSLPNFDMNEYLSVQDNLRLDWRIIRNLRLQGLISYMKQVNKSEIFKSPLSAEFRDEADQNKRGNYYIANSKQHTVDGNLTLAYFENIGDHIVNVGIGTNVRELESKGDFYTATGFVKESLDFIGVATQFKDKTKPNGLYDKSRLVGFFANINYGYANRYFVDFSYRTDGASSFGRNSRFAPFWSFGLAWNVHNEKFWNTDEHNYLKIRASMGSTGSVNFSSSQALTTYLYDFSSEYNGIYGVNFQGYGNPNLKWQTTKSYNVGIDWKFLKGRVELNCDAYIKLTNNLLTAVDVAPSTGFTSYVENIGEVKNQGIEGRLRVTLIDNKAKGFNWNVVLAAFSNRNRIQKLSNQMSTLNEQTANSLLAPKPSRIYQEGRSQSALVIIQSAGIDPATGDEVYIKADGSRTFQYDTRDQVVVGDLLPKMEGNVNTNLNWKGWNLYMLFKYKWGGKVYNGTLATKVDGANPYANVDRRAMEDRWKKPGDDVKFRRITSRTTPFQSTRLVCDDNLFSLESLSLSYDVPQKYLDYCRMERIRLMLSTTNIFRLSTIKQERGTVYPFARTFSIGLNITL